MTTRLPFSTAHWARAAEQAGTVEQFLAIAAAVIAPAQSRSAGLVLALFEGSSADAELARLATQMITSRAETARWLVDTMITKARAPGRMHQERGHRHACGS